MDVILTEEKMNQKSEIELLASPLGQDYIYVQHGVPPRKDLIHKGLRVMRIGILRDHTINNCGKTRKIEQYTFKPKLFFSIFNCIEYYDKNY